MRFRPKLPNDTVTLMTLATFIIVLTGLSIAAHDPASHHVKAISSIAAVTILGVYVAWLTSYLRSDPPGASGGTPRLPLPVGLGLLGAAGVGSAFVSPWVSAALDP